MYIQGFIILNRGVKEIPQRKSGIQVSMDMRITLASKQPLHYL